jgi:starch synthase (maltosyl-transferring)
LPRTAPCLLTLDARSLFSPDVRGALIARAAEIGFDGLLWQGFDILDHPGNLPSETMGLARFLAVDPGRFPLDQPLVAAQPAMFATRRASGGDGPIDPRKPIPATGEARARLHDASAWHILRPIILERLQALTATGVAGFHLIGSARLAPAVIADIAAALPDGITLLLDDSGARPPREVSAVVAQADKGLGVAVERYERLRPDMPLLVMTHDATGLAIAALTGDGLLVPAALLEAAEASVRAALTLSRAARPFAGELRLLSDSGAPVTALLRAGGERALLALINTTSTERDMPDGAIAFAGTDFMTFEPIEAGSPGPVAPGAARAFVAARAAPITLAPSPAGDSSAPRLVLESVTPSVDGGNFPVKRIVGERVTIEADLFGDGHEQLAAELQWRACDATEWRSVRMAEVPNDRWRAALTLDRLGRHEYAIEGWLDRFGGFRRDYRKKLDAGVASPVDRMEGRALVAEAIDRADPETGAKLARLLEEIDAVPDAAAPLLSDELAALMDVADDRPHRIRSRPQLIDAERLQARFSSWYELFPRSMSGDKDRHGTFADVIDHLPRIRTMGFDTLYFPPIHPIGTTNRKGPNNSLTPAPGDPGSPYAIGSADGGHDAIHPELGSFADFDRLVAAAAEQGLEIAIDFAIQCSPDHPWLKEHPGWFAWRPDGSMKYAENPPKKYQDIVNVDFYGPDAVPGLWLALRDVVLLWITHGVKTFRVDNPHTKPLPFWEWMIADVRARYPDAIFLAEAFTRPTMMYRLAKIGFSQSYTYFTWRDGKQELIDYVTELTTTAPKDFYRPHFFVNTPDINPLFLQTSGRPGFRIRAVLAATLSGLFGVYSGFELCESAALPGREEYLDSEKYELRPRDWAAPGNIIADITLLNRLRRTHPALQTHLNTRFHVAHNDSVIYYAKPEADGHGMILVMASLDPHGAQDTAFEVPLWEFGLPDDAAVAVEDLAAGHRFQWHGKMQTIRLAPDEPYRIWRIAPVEALA